MILFCGRNIEIGIDGYIWGFFCINGCNGWLLWYDCIICMVCIYLFDYKFIVFIIVWNGIIWLIVELDIFSGLFVFFDFIVEWFEEYYDWESNNLLSEVIFCYILEVYDSIFWIGIENGFYFINLNIC